MNNQFNSIQAENSLNVDKEIILKHKRNLELKTDMTSEEHSISKTYCS